MSAFLERPLSSTESDTLNFAPFTFTTHFEGQMGMYAPPPRVASYLNAHEEWFHRCAEPMQAEPFGQNGYVITVGHFKSFGYEVEPKMAVVLDPPKEGLYTMYSVAIPDYEPPGYHIDYLASLTLENPTEEVEWIAHPDAATEGITCVNWQLHLNVTVQFPRFIYRLPHDFLQTTGQNGLAQIIRQVSPRLTYKVQKDFHDQHDLPLPPKQSRRLTRILATETEC
jgi:hypothetical protein